MWAGAWSAGWSGAWFGDAGRVLEAGLAADGSGTASLRAVRRVRAALGAAGQSAAVLAALRRQRTALALFTLFARLRAVERDAATRCDELAGRARDVLHSAAERDTGACAPSRRTVRAASARTTQLTAEPQ